MNQPMSIQALLAFLGQNKAPALPQAQMPMAQAPALPSMPMPQAPMGAPSLPNMSTPNLQSLILPYPKQDAATKAYNRKMEEAKRMAGMADNIYGDYDPSVSTEQQIMEMNKRMLASGEPGFADQWSGNQRAMQGSVMSNLGQMERAKYTAANRRSPAAQMATELGYLPGTAQYNDFIQKYAAKRDVVNPDDEPLSTSELGKWMTTGGKPVTYLTPGMIKQGGYQLRNAMPGEAAGKTAMINTAIQYADVVTRNLIDEKTGEVNETVVNDMFIKDFLQDLPLGTVGDVISNAMMTPRGQAVANAFEYGIQGITRIETGAAMPQEELGNTRSRFIPRPFEDPAVTKQKIAAYNYFLKNAKNLIKPLKEEGVNYKEDAEAISSLINRAIDRAFMEVGLGMDNPPDGITWEGDEVEVKD
jgi:hypothetical protein